MALRSEASGSASSSASQLLGKENTLGPAAAVRTGGAVQPAGGVGKGPYPPPAVILSLNTISARPPPAWECVDDFEIWSGASFFDETLPRNVECFMQKGPKGKRAGRLREALEMAAGTYYEFLPLEGFQ